VEAFFFFRDGGVPETSGKIKIPSARRQGDPFYFISLTDRGALRVSCRRKDQLVCKAFINASRIVV
jgi:hypothetical protein